MPLGSKRIDSVDTFVTVVLIFFSKYYVLKIEWGLYTGGTYTHVNTVHSMSTKLVSLEPFTGTKPNKIEKFIGTDTSSVEFESRHQANGDVTPERNKSASRSGFESGFQVLHNLSTKTQMFSTRSRTELQYLIVCHWGGSGGLNLLNIF